MQILIVVGQLEGVAPPSAVVPRERHEAISKEIGDVGHAVAIAEVGHRRAYRRGLVVAHIHVGEVATHGEPSFVVVARREVDAPCAHRAIVYVARRRLTATHVDNVALYVVLRAAPYEATLEVEPMLLVLAISTRIAKANIHIITALGAYADVTHLEVLITEHLLDGGQAICLFVGELRLQLRDDEVCRCGAIAQGILTARGGHKLRGVAICRYRATHLERVVLGKERGVPALRQGEAILQARDVLHRLLIYGILCRLLRQ